MPSEAQETVLVTGAAGFIGSHLVEALLADGKRVIGLDNLSTGRRANLDLVRSNVKREQWNRFTFVDADIRDSKTCKQTCAGVGTVYHLAAMASVPQSIAQPELAHDVNVTGFLNVLIAAKENGVGHFIFASSSAVYGARSDGAARESDLPAPLSPYAATKWINEAYAEAFSASYRFRTVALRLFNIYGPRQTAAGPYASVIPLWIEAMASGRDPVLFGDGTATRSFCYVGNVVEAFLLAARGGPEKGFSLYNIAGTGAVAMADLFPLVRDAVAAHFPAAARAQLIRAPARPGDILHSRAATDLFSRDYGATVSLPLREGLEETVRAFVQPLADPLVHTAPVVTPHVVS